MKDTMEPSWNQIKNEHDITRFMKEVYYFHDSCLKEIRYLGGAYADRGGMYPINDKRMVRMVFQGYLGEYGAIEMEFAGIRHLLLNPISDEYTCEILSATMLKEGEFFYWCDENRLSISDFEGYCGQKEVYMNRKP